MCESHRSDCFAEIVRSRRPANLVPPDHPSQITTHPRFAAQAFSRSHLSRSEAGPRYHLLVRQHDQRPQAETLEGVGMYGALVSLAPVVTCGGGCAALLGMRALASFSGLLGREQFRPQMLSYSESTVWGYEPESRKWRANGTLVEHWVKG
jgi:hypothetical protein